MLEFIESKRASRGYAVGGTRALLMRGAGRTVLASGEPEVLLRVSGGAVSGIAAEGRSESSIAVPSRAKPVGLDHFVYQHLADLLDSPVFLISESLNISPQRQNAERLSSRSRRGDWHQRRRK
jgi:hypothetical protein